MMKPFPVIAPLFWLKGEENSILLDGLARLKAAGVDECILEARPFPGWLEPVWFDTLKTLLEFAEENSMRLWLFDDVHFPSGGAGGRIPEEFRKQLLCRRYADVAGCGGEYHLNAKGKGTERLFKAVCAPFVSPDAFDAEKAQDVTSQVKDGWLNLTLPAGRYRVFFIFVTREGGENHTRNWVNMLDAQAVDTFIDIVLEPHYRELKRFFDNGVFAGFFSDEPRMGSAPSYLSLPNGKFPCLPFSGELARRLEDMPAAFWPSLWHECQNAAEYRVKFMDEVSRLYSETFPGRVGTWCHEHHVQYIGHVVEDNGAHCRLGYGDGHFFRSVTGQDFPMVDSVLHQNIPGIEDGWHSSSFGPHDSAFFQWGLGKLASSAVHLYPEFGRQAICECFGAYGWSFGLDSMKRMTDHFAVQGINAFVPHAFSNAPYPDEDCPPHFYARGMNPQWKFFGLWCAYCKRVCALLSEGIHISGAAVLYHAEAEWSTRTFTPFERIGTKLMKAHYDYDVVPFDILETARVSNGEMRINGELFRALMVPSGMLLPKYEAILDRLADEGLKVFRGDEINEVAPYLTSPVEKGASENLRIYQYEVNGETRVFLVNESVGETIEFDLALDGSNLYDAVNDVSYAWDKHVRLLPGESLFAIVGGTAVSLPRRARNFVELSRKRLLLEENLNFELTAEIAPGKRTFIEVEQSIGVLEITCNGHRFQPLFAPPYRIEITDCVRRCNEISVELTCMPDADSPFDIEIPRKMDLTFKLMQAE